MLAALLADSLPRKDLRAPDRNRAELQGRSEPVPPVGSIGRTRRSSASGHHGPVLVVTGRWLPELAALTWKQRAPGVPVQHPCLQTDHSSCQDLELPLQRLWGCPSLASSQPELQLLVHHRRAVPRAPAFLAQKRAATEDAADPQDAVGEQLQPKAFAKEVELEPHARHKGSDPPSARAIPATDHPQDRAAPHLRPHRPDRQVPPAGDLDSQSYPVPPADHHRPAPRPRLWTFPQVFRSQAYGRLERANLSKGKRTSCRYYQP